MWVPLDDTDPTAPEGKCLRDEWRGPLWLGGREKGAPTFAYHPNTLSEDYCGDHVQKEPK